MTPRSRVARAALPVTGGVILAVTACGSPHVPEAAALKSGTPQASASGEDGVLATRYATPLQASLSWFYAINHRDKAAAVAHFVPGAAGMMNWGGGDTSTWSTFTAVHCTQLASRQPAAATVNCTFTESQSPSEGNPDTFWNVSLRRQPDGRWLIDNYGQG